MGRRVNERMKSGMNGEEKMRNEKCKEMEGGGMDDERTKSGMGEWRKECMGRRVNETMEGGMNGAEKMKKGKGKEMESGMGEEKIKKK